VKRLSNREKTYVLVFVVTLIWGGWHYRHLLDEKSEPPLSELLTVDSQAGTATQKPATTAAGATIIRQDPFQAAPWSGDPFHRTWRGVKAVAKTKQSTNPGALHLSSIVVRPDATYAVINGKIVREGEFIAGRTVTRIQKSLVVLDDRGVEVTLRL
jgi:hypothetical protein